MNENDGELPGYNKILSMEYLDMVFMEALRRHPAVGGLQRACVQDYKVPGTDITLKKDQEIFIPVAGIHADPAFYPEPEKFDPQRFSREEREKRHP